MSSSSEYTVWTTACTYILCTWYDASASNAGQIKPCPESVRRLIVTPSVHVSTSSESLYLHYIAQKNTLALYKEGRPLLRGTVECKL